MISILTIKKCIRVLLLFILLTPYKTITAETNIQNTVNIYFFYSKDCAHCHQETKYLDKIENKHSNVNIYKYEIHDSNNNELRIKVQKLYNVKTNCVPLTIIGDTAYSGYSSEKSNIIFTKTIKYYSRYGYLDKVGELLNNETKTNYKIDEQAPSLDEFLKTYGNYKLIKNLYTDDLEPSSIALILGIISQFNIIKILALVTILIILKKIKQPKTYLKYIITYLLISFILNVTNIASNNLTLITNIILAITIIILTILCIKRKEKKYLYSSLIMSISLISNYLEKHLIITYPKIFAEILELHHLSPLNQISYYGNYIFTIFIINITIFLIIYLFKNKKENTSNKISY